jgi:hypothetical protein
MSRLPPNRPHPDQPFGSPPGAASPQYNPHYEQEPEVEPYDRPTNFQSDASHSGFVNQHDYDQGGFDPYGKRDQLLLLHFIHSENSWPSKTRHRHRVRAGCLPRPLHTFRVLPPRAPVCAFGWHLRLYSSIVCT